MKQKLLSLATPITLGLTLIFCTQVQAAGKIDPVSPDGFVQVMRKMQCSLKDSDPQIYSFQGRAYSRIPGERDKHLFNLDGMNIRECVTVKDDKRGTGFKVVSREVMLYIDPKTNEVMRTFENPWTGASNEVIQVANDPVNFPATFGRDADGNPSTRPIKEINGTWFMPAEIPLFYTNPLGGDYQQYVGGTYHATEIFDFMGDMDEMLDPKQPVAYANVAWVRIAQWLPWMEMGSRTGLLYFNAVGKKIENFDQLTDVMKTEIKANYPEYVAPPPTDDTRPNETSWTYMKKIIDSRSKAETKQGSH